MLDTFITRLFFGPMTCLRLFIVSSIGNAVFVSPCLVELDARDFTHPYAFGHFNWACSKRKALDALENQRLSGRDPNLRTTSLGQMRGLVGNPYFRVDISCI
jgi:hypothetical protein